MLLGGDAGPLPGIVLVSHFFEKSSQVANVHVLTVASGLLS